jgi:signal transduction histidine kinase
VATSVYRIAQEALQNVVKHAGATNARLRLQTHGDTITLEVEDDGQGFIQTTNQTGYGLPGMRERAELLGGTLEVKSYPGQGTLLRLRFPASTEQSTNHLSVPPE